jgi:hypothetical protein
LGLTPDVALNFLTCVRLGNYREVAAAHAGISRATLYRWLRDPRPPFVAFRRALDQAEAQVEVEVVANLMRLSAKSTRAAEFLLTRRFPDQWSEVPRKSRSSTTPGIADGQTQMASGPYVIIPRELVEGSAIGVG